MANFDGPQIKSKTIKADSPQVAVADTSGYQAMANGLASMGTNVAGAISSIDKNGDGKEGSRLDKRIEKAKQKGNESKAARLTGKKERRDIKDKNKADKIASKNKDKKDALIKSEFFKGQKFNEKQKEKGGTTSSSHLFKPTSSLKPKGISEMEPEFSLASPFDMKTFDKFSKIAKKL